MPTPLGIVNDTLDRESAAMLCVCRVGAVPVPQIPAETVELSAAVAPLMPRSATGLEAVLTRIVTAICLQSGAR